MKEWVILSGKGGTGKTTVAAALAHLASQSLAVQGRALTLVDADVDAANLELVLAPTLVASHPFWSGQVAVVDERACTACGRCAEVCRFDAILPGETYRVDPLACEGCAACRYQCPAAAIQMVEQHAGEWYRSETRFGAPPGGVLFHAHLFAGQENSGKLVTEVKQAGRLWAKQHEIPLILIDGPPGIGCPVIAASTGTDWALIVVEPTVSGVHDLVRVLETTAHFRVPAAVIVNKADLNPTRVAEIIRFCAAQGVKVVGQIPYDTAATQAIVAGQPVTAFGNNPVAGAMIDIWARLRVRLSS